MREPRGAGQANQEISLASARENHFDDSGTIKLGSQVKIVNLSEKGRKLAFTLVDNVNDLDNGKLGVNTPLGRALIDSQEGDTVEYQVGVEIKKVEILKVT